jgi:hypothetical protein
VSFLLICSFFFFFFFFFSFLFTIGAHKKLILYTYFTTIQSARPSVTVSHRDASPLRGMSPLHRALSPAATGVPEPRRHGEHRHGHHHHHHHHHSSSAASGGGSGGISVGADGKRRKMRRRKK